MLNEYIIRLVLAQSNYMAIHLNNLIKRIRGEELKRDDMWYEQDALSAFCIEYCHKYKVDEVYFNYWRANTELSCVVPSVYIKREEE